MIIEGRAIKYGDNINTDLIIPGRYLILNEPKDLAEHAMEDLDPNFFKKFNFGDILVVGRNFGCGSSREQAAICLKYAGVSAIIAESFARIFFRNAINLGLPIIQSKEVVDCVNNFDILKLDFKNSNIFNKKQNKDFSFNPLPDFIQKIITDGGLISHIKKNQDLID